MHPKNKHQDRYDFKQLISQTPALKNHVLINEFGIETIDFSNPASVKELNRSLLKSFYGISNWDIPDNFLCPPVPGRADYIHYVSDLLENPKDQSVVGLDIGVGANCIYPIIGRAEYGWKFVGSEIHPSALNGAQRNVANNQLLREGVEIRAQKLKDFIFKGIIQPKDRFHFTMCNPPFHASAEDAAAATERKNKNLGLKKQTLNFGGKPNELWCPGGEFGFVSQMIAESAFYKNQVLWFTTLISKKDHLSGLQERLKREKPYEMRVIEMAQGQKVSRILAWTFVPNKER